MNSAWLPLEQWTTRNDLRQQKYFFPFRLTKKNRYPESQLYKRREETRKNHGSTLSHVPEILLFFLLTDFDRGSKSFFQMTPDQAIRGEIDPVRSPTLSSLFLFFSLPPISSSSSFSLYLYPSTTFRKEEFSAKVFGETFSLPKKKSVLRERCASCQVFKRYLFVKNRGLRVRAQVSAIIVIILRKFFQFV